jgi:chondroitin AC lyase
MKNTFIIAIFILTGIVRGLAQQYDFDILIQRIQTDAFSGVKDPGQVDAWVASQNSNGSWADFKYGALTTSTATNTTDNHILRLWNVAALCSRTDHSKYNNAAYKQSLLKGLEFWHNSGTTDPNWWYNKIYFPQKLGEILIFMREFDGFIPRTTVSGIDEPEILAAFQPQAVKDITINGTGANAIDIALHYIYRGILTQNTDLLEDTKDLLDVSVAEKIQNDLVYHDHGPQIQISSYGWVLADGMIKLASYLGGTPAAFDVNSPNFNKLVKFIRETQISSIRASAWDFSVLGRAVSRINATNAGVGYFSKMAQIIDPENAAIYNDAIARINGSRTPDYNVREFNKHYWVSDYTQHARKSYLFTVRNVSTRTVESETGNNENLKANYFSHGTTFISVDGNEYKNIMPIWDWNMIPGSTFPYYNTYPARSVWGVNFGLTGFVGGVSDGIYGASVLDFSHKATRAKKSWFFFDSEVVCLGAGISDNSGMNVRTTVNQTKMDAPSYYEEASSDTEKMSSVSSSTYAKTNLKYLRNGKIAYFFPQQNDLKFTMKSQSGSWKDINQDGSATVESGYVFTLWFDHGLNPVSASYSYVVVPGIDTQEKAQAYDVSKVEIVENSVQKQAVAHKSLNLLQVIFHQAGSITYNEMEISANRPCALMLKNGSLVTVSDPAQQNSVILVTIKYKGVEYKKFVSLNTDTGMSGTSVTVDFQIPTDIQQPSALDKVKITNSYTSNQQKIRIESEIPRILMYEIRNSRGQLLDFARFDTITEISVNPFPQGLLLVSVTDGTNKFVHKSLKL